MTAPQHFQTLVYSAASRILGSMPPLAKFPKHNPKLNFELESVSITVRLTVLPRPRLNNDLAVSETAGKTSGVLQRFCHQIEVSRYGQHVAHLRERKMHESRSKAECGG